jgi:uncharacterized protein (DUF2147 family)
MKKYMLAVFLLHTAISIAAAQDPDAILGFWHSPHGHTDIQIVKSGDIYSGVTVFLNGTHNGHNHFELDTGTVILRDFKYRGNGIYTRGKVLDSRSGRTYNGQMRLITDERLDIRIFFGIIQFGRTETWTRVSE